MKASKKERNKRLQTLPLDTYLDEFSMDATKNLDDLHSVSYDLWGYQGEQPRKWVDDCIRKARAFLRSTDGRGKRKRRYVDFVKFMKNQLLARYDWEKPQEMKTYINNDNEQKYYKRKE